MYKYIELDIEQAKKDRTYPNVNLNNIDVSELEDDELVGLFDYDINPDISNWNIKYIPNDFFEYNKQIKKIIIPNSVTSIGYSAFYECINLESVTIPNSVESIGNDAFNNCSNLTSITIHNSVKNIGNNAFRNCINLESVIIPDSVTRIGDYAFFDCKDLKSVTISNRVETIGISAFYNCSSLEYVTIPNSIGGNKICPFIINGRPLKSINQYYNKKLGLLKSRQDKCNNKDVNSRKIRSLTNKRNNKIKDYLHKASRILVNQLVSNNVSLVVIGHNKEWKQDINIGKVNNQKFVQIPYNQLIQMITYKSELQGIKVIQREESYTSKCSFMDNETICKHETYMGKRIKRGLFRSATGRFINADLNGALNILKKEIPNAFDGYGIEVCSTPVVLTTK